jgi:hypothetical protein
MPPAEPLFRGAGDLGEMNGFAGGKLELIRRKLYDPTDT